MLGALLVLCAVSAQGCVTYDVEPERPSSLDPSSVQPVRIPLEGRATDPRDAAVADYYDKVLAQLQDALVGRDLPLLRSLVAAHDRESAPDWFKDNLARYRRMATVLEFEVHAVSVAAIRAVTPNAAVGEPLAFELSIPSATRPDIVLPGVDGDLSPERFLVQVAVTDLDCYGGRTVRRSASLVSLQETVKIGAGDPLVQPFGLPALAAEGCLRKVAISVDWMPGNVVLADGPAPHGRASLARRTFTFYPRGIGPLKENPYTTLRNAIESGDSKYFDNLFLAARLMPDSFREDALRKLIQGVRVGRPDVVRACTAALREITGENLPLGNRDAWLGWWAGRPAAH